MKVSQISQTNFTAGIFYLKNIDTNKVKCCDAIKKMAEDRNIDIYIIKRQDPYHLPTHDLYTIIGNMLGVKHSTNCELINHKTSAGELSVRIYNAAVNTMEHIEKILSK